ncbi:class I SAM-dependent methyltransferase [uncultured Thiodictyon sp.]|uniref:class I SAM-dependent methyltransferase n=1 Tax=uncultured Thiodictyon sp. TaxID=1846217 RepID=UPI0025E572AC|nr:class I SAM-dependent methyltransferase [uncultured Thiodictyon sp.]
MGKSLSNRVRTYLFDRLLSLAATRGYQVTKRHYYSPVPDAGDCSSPGFWDAQSALTGVDLGAQRGLDLLDRVFPPYLAEFRSRYGLHAQNSQGRFYLINGIYMAVDAHVYYCLVRHLKPKRIIEIGSGQSTRVALDALAANRDLDGVSSTLTAVEPYPAPVLKALAADGRLELLETKVQDLGTGFFASLTSGDLLFIDSTHVLREGNDVQFEYLELLPRLPTGVYVHIHDISLPRRYPKVYFDQGIYWNEQYLLQAFLAFNTRFETMWAGNFLLLSHPERMHAAFPEIAAMREEYPGSEPSAFWMRTI